MMYNRTKRKFACTQCGITYEAYPPDDVHTEASTDHCLDCNDDYPEETIVNYECDNCNKFNEIFWHIPVRHTDHDKYGTSRNPKIDLDLSSLRKTQRDSFDYR